MNCKICGSNEIKKSGSSILNVSCPYCGDYFITSDAEAYLELSPLESAKISSVLRASTISGTKKYGIFQTMPEGKIDIYIPMTKETLLNEYPKDIFRRMELALVNLQKMSGFSGDKIKLEMKDKPVMYPEVWDSKSTFFILQMLNDLGYIISNIGIPTKITITSKGWSKLYELQKKNVTSNQAFIAMWFNQSMDNASKAIHNAIRSCKYEPRRIDVVEHNNKICDQIIAEIKQSKFLVSDFTGHRGGVYYEAGFAHGLGIPVIFTCHEDDVNELHFDTRQFNHIVWSDEKDLKEKLIHRIRATIS